MSRPAISDPRWKQSGFKATFLFSFLEIIQFIFLNVFSFAKKLSLWFRVSPHTHILSPHSDKVSSVRAILLWVDEPILKHCYLKSIAHMRIYSLFSAFRGVQQMDNGVQASLQYRTE